MPRFSLPSMEVDRTMNTPSGTASRSALFLATRNCSLFIERKGGIEDLLGQVFMVGKGFAAIYAYKKMKKYITPQIKDKVEAKLDEWFHENVMEVVEPLYLE